MSGARRMQGFRYCREGATLVISLEGLNWLSKRRCRSKRPSKRDEDLHLLMPSGQLIQTDEELQPITCLCILDQRRDKAPHSQGESSDSMSGLLAWPPPLHSCLTMDPSHHSTSTFLASFVSEAPPEGPWKRLILDMKDFFRLITKSFNIVTQQDFFAMLNKLTIFFDEDIPKDLFGDIYNSGDCRESMEDAQWHLSENMTSNVKKSTAKQLQDVNNNTNNSVEIQHNEPQKSSLIYGALKVSSGRDKTGAKRKRVSFVDDVTVYLFDQESPTVELRAGPCTFLPSSYSCILPEVTFEDTGLEWEDDFSALEKNCHFQHVRCAPQHNFSLPAQSCTAASRLERFSLSQTCLFLTHVTESDLEL
ncbi:uncharacterized protein LOC121528651 isoform X2 [Cheilinus undulatus]|uniref:uncharacterized protein LOC121528651 isoform X2 n=1 Tax=Cheilinus undulatus TaxID=241271 RepID=UPI001BD283EB|nr:uncharacterized protein LOC121528651 isoform X2 [Cheilinus undulatus]